MTVLDRTRTAPHACSTRCRGWIGDLAFTAAAVLIGSVGILSACHAQASAEPQRADIVERLVPSAVEPSAVEPSAVESGPAATAVKGNPLRGASPLADDGLFSAVIVERVAAGGYTYVRLKTEQGEHRWLATMGDGEAPGVQVAVHAYSSREDFHSRRTGMTFDRLLFGSIEPEA